MFVEWRARSQGKVRTCKYKILFSHRTQKNRKKNCKNADNNEFLLIFKLHFVSFETFGKQQDFKHLKKVT